MIIILYTPRGRLVSNFVKTLEINKLHHTLQKWKLSTPEKSIITIYMKFLKKKSKSVKFIQVLYINCHWYSFSNIHKMLHKWKKKCKKYQVENNGIFNIIWIIRATNYCPLFDSNNYRFFIWKGCTISHSVKTPEVIGHPHTCPI